MKVLLGIAFALAAFIVIGAFLSSTSSRSAVAATHVSAPDPLAQPCTAADFSLRKLRASTEYDAATLTGIVTNHCKSAVGVQLKWTAFNSDGSVAFSDDFWPASTTNIPPGTDYAFEMMNSAPRGRWTYTVEPVSIETW